MSTTQQPEALRARSLPEIKDMHNGPQQLNLSDRAMWVLGWNECRDAARDADRAMSAAHPENFDHGPQATSTEEAARDVGKWLNERPNRPLDLRHVAMLCAHAQPAGAQQPGTAHAAHGSEHQQAIMEAERNASLDAYSRVVYLTGAESRLYEAGFTNGWQRASHGQAPAQAAPAAVAGPEWQMAPTSPDEWMEAAGDEQLRLGKNAGDVWDAMLAAAPTAQPAPANATAPSYDTLQLYKDLQDLWAEANAVDTVIGRPEVLMAKIAKMRDTVGQMTATYLPSPQQEAQERVYLVATGETLNGRELYERHEKYVPLADCETLYTAPQESRA